MALSSVHLQELREESGKNCALREELEALREAAEDGDRQQLQRIDQLERERAKERAWLEVLVGGLQRHG